MDENDFLGKLTRRLIKATMDGLQNCVKVSGGLSSLFESCRGLRQDDGLSCLLFNFTQEGGMRQIVRFADEMDIITAKTFGTVAEKCTPA